MTLHHYLLVYLALGAFFAIRGISGPEKNQGIDAKIQYFFLVLFVWLPLLMVGLGIVGLRKYAASQNKVRWVRNIVLLAIGAAMAYWVFWGLWAISWLNY